MMRRKAAMAALIVAAAAGMASYWTVKTAGWRTEQLTSCANGASGFPQISDDGKEIYFLSSCDLTGNNRDQNHEIFRWREGRLAQLTDTPNCTITDLVLARGSSKLAFATNCQFDGKNPGRGLEVAVMDGASISVITKGSGYPSRRPAWSPDRRSIAFESQANFTGQNRDGGNDIFVASLSGLKPVVSQVTRAATPSTCEAPNLFGDYLVCRCNDDAPGTAKPPEGIDLPTVVEGRTVGGNPDKNWEIMSFSLDGSPRQLTYTSACENGPPVLSPNGRVIAFVSNCAFSGRQTTLPIRELVFLTSEIIRPFPGFSFDGINLAWSGDGRKLAFTSIMRIGDLNRDQNAEIFLFTLPTIHAQELKTAFHEKTISDFIQPVTDCQNAASLAASLRKDGGALAFISTANSGEKNPDRSPEVFLATWEQPPDDFETASGDSASPVASPQPAPGGTADVIVEPKDPERPSLGPGKP